MSKTTLELAEKLDLILNSEDEAHDGLQDALEEILCECANQGNMAIWSPEIIKLTFPFLMDSLNRDYARGIHHALTMMLDSRLVDEETKAKFDAIHDKHWQREDVLDAEEIHA